MTTKTTARKLTAWVFIGWLLTSMGIAQDPQSDDASQDLAVILLSEEWLNRFFDEVVEVAPEIRLPVPEAKGGRDKLISQFQKMRPEFLSTIQWPKLRKRLAIDLSSRFSEDELKALVTFYRSDIGRKWLKTQPAISVEFFKSAAGDLFNSYMQERGRKNLATMESEMDDSQRKALAAARQGPPIPADLIQKQWFEIDDGDPTLRNYNSVNVRTGNGLMTSGGRSRRSSC